MPTARRPKRFPLRTILARAPSVIAKVREKRRRWCVACAVCTTGAARATFASTQRNFAPSCPGARPFQIVARANSASDPKPADGQTTNCCCCCCCRPARLSAFSGRESAHFRVCVALPDTRPEPLLRRGNSCLATSQLVSCVRGTGVGERPSLSVRT